MRLFIDKNKKNGRCKKPAFFLYNYRGGEIMKTAWINMNPVCSECGHSVNYAVVREDILESDNGKMYKQYIVRPQICVKCESLFCGTRVKEEKKDGI